MPRRTTILAVGECYHIFNRSIANEPIFLGSKDYLRFLHLVDYYRFKKPPIRFSHYNRLEKELRGEFINKLHTTGKKLVEIYAFSFMPNHYHLLLKQLEERGISDFVRNLQNSYAKFINTKYDRVGSLFQEMFKASRIQSEEQLIHVLRYIHLNPLTDFVIKDIKELATYPWTSFSNFIKPKKESFLEVNFVLKFFQSRDKLKQFTFDQVDYQRKLSRIKHLIKE